MVVSQIDGNGYRVWKPVVRPTPKSNFLLPNVKHGPPVVAPKPGGKVLVYVYEAPGSPGRHQATLQSGRFPPGAQLIAGPPPVQLANGSVRNYPYSDELVDHESPSARIQRRSKKAGKGYKVLADVNSRGSRSSSKGGKMFMKQKKRMDQYTSPESSGRVEESSDERPKSANPRIGRSSPMYLPRGNYDNRSLPREKKRKGKFLAPLRSPPAEWRAKVDSDFPFHDDCQTLPYQRWHSVDATNMSHSARSESAPPFKEDTDEDYDYHPGSINQNQSRYEVGAVRVNFDAKMHKGAPHRKQGVRSGRGIFMTTPHVQYDFNARPVGWSRAFALHY